MLSASPYITFSDDGTIGVMNGDESLVFATSAPPPPPQELLGGAGSAEEDPPFPLDQTFNLHSLPGATKTIYLDFDGHLTRNTGWNSGFDIENILTPALSLDDDFAGFNDEERLLIQQVWERVAEDFRPFDVNVTTQDPGTEALRNSGDDDEMWGIRVVIGGSTNDWYTPVTDNPVGGVAFLSSFSSDIDVAAFAFGADFSGDDHNLADVISHETGHTLGLSHDGQDLFFLDTSDPDNPEFVRIPVEYYPGHGYPPGGPTGWAPIMGVGYGQSLTQWGQGEYPNATNIQDDLAIITTNNGFGYRPDDHGGSIATATPLGLNSDETLYFGEGLIEQNTDVDYFTFTVEGLGEAISFDILPFYRGPNLDILAKIYDASGSVIAENNPVDDLHALFSETILLPGTYYLSVEGTGRPITFIDPAFHPGPVELADPLPVDMSDWGYTDYGSLGYYSIAGTRKKGLVVGVDFDGPGGTTPENWRLFAGGAEQTVLTGLTSEAGVTVPYELTISTTGTMIETFASANPINSDALPDHALPLDGLDGYIAGGGDEWTFTWSNLDPSSVYQLYVFGHADLEAFNEVSVVGGEWNGIIQTFNFTQDVEPDSLVVNDFAPTTNALPTLSLLAVSDSTGRITITVDNELGFAAALGGLAIAPTKPGVIEGRKWNDANGNGLMNGGEEGLEDWIIYLDLNNNGQLDLISTTDEQIAVSSPNVPQVIEDNATVKNDLFFAAQGAIVDVDVTIDIDHEFAADLELYLISPTGTRVKLMDDNGSFGENFHGTVFDDSASRSITSILPTEAPFTGSFRPIEPLSILNGENSAGTWTLEITDDAGRDTGVLNSWSVDITVQGIDVYVEPFTVTDASGNYSFTNLPPGEYHVREHFQDFQTQEGWVPTPVQSEGIAPINLRSGETATGVNFGNWIPVTLLGSISGLKYNDLDGDGEQDLEEPGMAGWVVYIDSNNNGMRDVASQPSTVAATDLPQPILDGAATTSQVTLDELGTILNIEVTLDVTHSYVGDLEAYLIGPSGQTVELFTSVGGQFNNLDNLTLADNAARSIATLSEADVPYSGRWQPEGSLSNFFGKNANGTWTLEVRDSATGDQGTLNSWSLTVTIGELFTGTGEDGTYSFVNLPAGQYVVREEPQNTWVQVPPATTTIPSAVWSNSQWLVTVVGQDNPTDPNGADSARNVKNVDFGNKTTLSGDYNRDGTVDAADYILWRKTLAASVPPYSGADGNGSGSVDEGDHGIWAENFGRTSSGGGGGAAIAEAQTSGDSPAPADTGVESEAISESLLAESDDSAIEASDSGAVPASLYYATSSSYQASSNATALTGGSTAPTASKDAALVAWLATLADADEELTDGGNPLVPDSSDWTAELWDESLESIDSVFEVLGVA